MSIQSKEQISNTRLKIKDDLRSTNKRISFLDEQKKKLEEKLEARNAVNEMH